MFQYSSDGVWADFAESGAVVFRGRSEVAAAKEQAVVHGQKAVETVAVLGLGFDVTGDERGASVHEVSSRAAAIVLQHCDGLESRASRSSWYLYLAAIVPIAEIVAPDPPCFWCCSVRRRMSCCC